MGILNDAELRREVATARRNGWRLVMTNGCFDLLHAGHVAGLQAAARLGDRLLVAVNDDASVRLLKGAGRPAVPLCQRLAALDALDCVDWVIPFADPTPLRLVAVVLPDVLAKGSDYRVDQVVGAELVIANGGEVVIIERVGGHSTSGLLPQGLRPSPGSAP